MADADQRRAVTCRVDLIDLPALEAIVSECNWLRFRGVTGSGFSRLINLELDVPVYAWRKEDTEPSLHSGPWNISLVLARGVALQPQVQVAGHDGYLPAGGNISDWWTVRGAFPGLLCWADRWDASRYTLGWVVYQSAMIVTGQAIGLEAQPLSRRGRDWQAEALRAGLLPSHRITRPADRWLLVQESEPTELKQDGIEFDD